MKLMIDIPEKVVTAIQNGEDYRYDIHTAIAQGIPQEERPQGDLISREALKKVMNEEALNLSNGGRIFIENINKIIDNASAVEIATKLQPNCNNLQQEPPGDLINREALKCRFAQITYVRFTADMGQGSFEMFSEKEIEDIIDKAPAIDISGNEYFPYRSAYFNGVEDGRATAITQGEWIYRENFKKHQCNKCGMFMPFSKEDIEEGYKLPNFCSNCGADMRKGDSV